MRWINWITPFFPVPLFAISLTADQLKINGSITTADGNVSISWGDHANFQGAHAEIDRAAGKGELRGEPLGALLSYTLPSYSIQTYFPSALLTINQAMLPTTLLAPDSFKITVDTTLEIRACRVEITWDEEDHGKLLALTMTHKEKELTCSHPNFELMANQATFSTDGSKLTLDLVSAFDTDEKKSSFSSSRVEWHADQRQLYCDGPVRIDHPLWGTLQACGMTFFDITLSPFRLRRAVIHPPLSLSYRGHHISSASPVTFDADHRRVMLKKLDGAPAPTYRAEDFTVAANQVEALMTDDFKEASYVTFKEDVIIRFDDPQAMVQSIHAHRVEFTPADHCLIATPRSGELIYFWSSDRKSYLTCEKITLHYDPEKKTRTCQLLGQIKALLNSPPPGLRP